MRRYGRAGAVAAAASSITSTTSGSGSVPGTTTSSSSSSSSPSAHAHARSAGSATKSDSSRANANGVTTSNESNLGFLMSMGGGGGGDDEDDGIDSRKRQRALQQSHDVDHDDDNNNNVRKKTFGNVQTARAVGGVSASNLRTAGKSKVILDELNYHLDGFRDQPSTVRQQSISSLARMLSNPDTRAIFRSHGLAAHLLSAAETILAGSSTTTSSMSTNFGGGSNASSMLTGRSAFPSSGYGTTSSSSAAATTAGFDSDSAFGLCILVFLLLLDGGLRRNLDLMTVPMIHILIYSIAHGHRDAGLLDPLIAPILSRGGSALNSIPSVQNNKSSLIASKFVESLQLYVGGKTTTSTAAATAATTAIAAGTATKQTLAAVTKPFSSSLPQTTSEFDFENTDEDNDDDAHNTRNGARVEKSGSSIRSTSSPSGAKVTMDKFSTTTTYSNDSSSTAPPPNIFIPFSKLKIATTTQGTILPHELALYLLVRFTQLSSEDDDDNDDGENNEATADPSSMMMPGGGGGGGTTLSAAERDASDRAVAHHFASARDAVRTALNGKGLLLLAIVATDAARSVWQMASMPLMPSSSLAAGSSSSGLQTISKETISSFGFGISQQFVQPLARLRLCLQVLEDVSFLSGDNTALLAQASVLMELLSLSPSESLHRKVKSDSSNAAKSYDVTPRPRCSFVAVLLSIIEWSTGLLESIGYAGGDTASSSRGRVAGSSSSNNSNVIPSSSLPSTATTSSSLQQKGDNTSNATSSAATDHPVMEVMLGCLRVLINMTNNYTPGCRAVTNAAQIAAINATSSQKITPAPSTTATTLPNASTISTLVSFPSTCWGMGVIVRVIACFGTQHSKVASNSSDNKVSPTNSNKRHPTQLQDILLKPKNGNPQKALSTLASAHVDENDNKQHMPAFTPTTSCFLSLLAQQEVAHFDTLVLSLGLLANCVEHEISARQALLKVYVDAKACGISSSWIRRLYQSNNKSTSTNNASRTVLTSSSSSSAPKSLVPNHTVDSEGKISAYAFAAALFVVRFQLLNQKSRTSSSTANVSSNSMEAASEDGDGEDDSSTVAGDDDMNADDVVVASYLALLLGCAMREGASTQEAILSSLCALLDASVTEANDRTSPNRGTSHHAADSEVNTTSSNDATGIYMPVAAAIAALSYVLKAFVALQTSTGVLTENTMHHVQEVQNLLDSINHKSNEKCDEIDENDEEDEDNANKFYSTKSPGSAAKSGSKNSTGTARYSSTPNTVSGVGEAAIHHHNNQPQQQQSQRGGIFGNVTSTTESCSISKKTNVEPGLGARRANYLSDEDEDKDKDKDKDKMQGKTSTSSSSSSSSSSQSPPTSSASKIVFLPPSTHKNEQLVSRDHQEKAGRKIASDDDEEEDDEYDGDSDSESHKESDTATEEKKASVSAPALVVVSSTSSSVSKTDNILASTGISISPSVSVPVPTTTTTMSDEASSSYFAVVIPAPQASAASSSSSSSTSPSLMNLTPPPSARRVLVSPSSSPSSSPSASSSLALGGIMAGVASASPSSPSTFPAKANGTVHKPSGTPTDTDDKGDFESKVKNNTAVISSTASSASSSPPVIYTGSKAAVSSPVAQTSASASSLSSLSPPLASNALRFARPSSSAALAKESFRSKNASTKPIFSPALVRRSSSSGSIGGSIGGIPSGSPTMLSLLLNDDDDDEGDENYDDDSGSKDDVGHRDADKRGDEHEKHAQKKTSNGNSSDNKNNSPKKRVPSSPSYATSPIPEITKNNPASSDRKASSKRHDDEDKRDEGDETDEIVDEDDVKGRANRGNDEAEEEEDNELYRRVIAESSTSSSSSSSSSSSPMGPISRSPYASSSASARKLALISRKNNHQSSETHHQTSSSAMSSPPAPSRTPTSSSSSISTSSAAAKAYDSSSPPLRRVVAPIGGSSSSIGSITSRNTSSSSSSSSSTPMSNSLHRNSTNNDGLIGRRIETVAFTPSTSASSASPALTSSTAGTPASSSYSHKKQQQQLQHHSYSGINAISPAVATLGRSIPLSGGPALGGNSGSSSSKKGYSSTSSGGGGSGGTSTYGSRGGVYGGHHPSRSGVADDDPFSFVATNDAPKSVGKHNSGRPSW